MASVLALLIFTLMILARRRFRQRFSGSATPKLFWRDERGVRGETRSFFGSLIALAAIGLGFFLLRDRLVRRPIETQMDAKGIAVLPFENFSDDKENAFFADGIQDDILTSLARIKDLRVISRTSVMGYRGAAVHSLREIGQALGIANILEGSVRREGNRVVVTVQLIDALTDRHLWANRYDRTLADSLGLQGELAAEIAEALRVTLSPDEKARVETKPTENSEAYVFYLRANQIARNPDTLLEDLNKAEQFYVQAITLDPNFALAHARLASTRAQIYHYYEPLDTWKAKALAEAELALRLQPNLAEAHLALGQCAYWLDQDYERALAEFGAAAALSPSDAEIGRLIASIKTPAGKMAGVSPRIRKGSEDRSAKSKYRSRTCLYQHRAAALAGGGSLGNANANDGARFTCRQNSKRLCRFLVEG